MREFIFILFLLTSDTVAADTIQKWIDDSGQIHYGDSTPPSNATRSRSLDIQNTFDPVAYEQAVKRNRELNKKINELERREKAAAKTAKKRLDEYFEQLEHKKSERERIKLQKKKAREGGRNHSSIKLKRGKGTKKPLAKKSPLSLQ